MLKQKLQKKVLLIFLTFVCLPKSVWSDQGSDCMSGYFWQHMHELDIQQFNFSVYHSKSLRDMESHFEEKYQCHIT